MTDAHFHRNGFETFLCLGARECRFLGVHPWQVPAPEACAGLRARLEADIHAGVGEIGLDRLKTRVVPEAQRTVLADQLEIAAALRRPVALHGAKCWGEVVQACRPYATRIPAFLFHGFSRSTGLLPEIFSLNGFVSLGPSLLNDHAVNYREMAKTLPEDRLLVETDVDWSAPNESTQVDMLGAIVRKLAELRGVAVDALAASIDAAAERFVEALA